MSTPAFDPNQFISLALDLTRVNKVHPSGVEAARVRTALGRAYYGLYLQVRTAIAGRHGVPLRRLRHGPVYTHLQNSRLPVETRALGRYLQHLYTLRQKADYELSPDELWRSKLGDPEVAAAAAVEARRLARMIPSCDFSPVAHLF
jgi:hypothetical protein